MATAARRSIALFAAGALFVALVGSADADIDPASDVLPLQDVFLPYKPKVCSGLSDSLRKLTKTSKDADYPIKVAVIGSKADLGGAASLFGKPQDYAQFLARELVTYSPDYGKSFGTEPLLTVMPAGFGIIGGGPNADKVLKEVPIPSGAKPNELVRASLNVIPKLAQAAGHPVAAPKVAASCSKSGGGTSVVIFIAPIAVLLVGGLLAGSRLRPRRGESK
jgi:hypothetical protein